MREDPKVLSVRELEEQQQRRSDDDEAAERLADQLCTGRPLPPLEPVGPLAERRDTAALAVSVLGDLVAEGVPVGGLRARIVYLIRELRQEYGLR